MEKSASDHFGIGISPLIVELLGTGPDLLVEGGVLNTGLATSLSVIEGSGVLALSSGEFFRDFKKVGPILSKMAGWMSSVALSSGISSFLATPALIVFSEVIHTHKHSQQNICNFRICSSSHHPSYLLQHSSLVDIEMTPIQTEEHEAISCTGLMFLSLGQKH